MRLGKIQEAGVPQAQENPRCQQCLPSRLRGDDAIHQREKAIGVILHFHVNIKLDVLVLGLTEWERGEDKMVSAPGD